MKMRPNIKSRSDTKVPRSSFEHFNFTDFRSLRPKNVFRYVQRLHRMLRRAEDKVVFYKERLRKVCFVLANLLIVIHSIVAFCRNRRTKKWFAMFTSRTILAPSKRNRRSRKHNQNPPTRKQARRQPTILLDQHWLRMFKVGLIDRFVLFYCF